jgi:hypothetical protein
MELKTKRNNKNHNLVLKQGKKSMRKMNHAFCEDKEEV